MNGFLYLSVSTNLFDMLSRQETHRGSEGLAWPWRSRSMETEHPCGLYFFDCLISFLRVPVFSIFPFYVSITHCQAETLTLISSFPLQRKAKKIYTAKASRCVYTGVHVPFALWPLTECSMWETGVYRTKTADFVLCCGCFFILYFFSPNCSIANWTSSISSTQCVSWNLNLSLQCSFI